MKDIGDTTEFSNWVKGDKVEITKPALDSFFKILKKADGDFRADLLNRLRVMVQNDANLHCILSDQWENLNGAVFTYFNTFNL